MHPKIIEKQEQFPEIAPTNNFFDPLSKLHEEARSFLHTLGFLFEEEFYETNESEQIKFLIPHEDGRKKIKCWLKCSYPPSKQDGTPGLCITFGAFHPSLPQHDTKTFWADSNFELTQEKRLSINERIAEGKQRADEREKEIEKTDNEKANWCLEKYKKALIRGKSPYFDEKGIKPIGIRYEIRKDHREGTKETVALIPLRNIKGQIRAIQEIYPSKRKFHGDDKPRNKNARGAYSGCFFTFGKIEDGKPICIAEGCATAASIFQSTNYTTLMVVSCTNILKVVKEIKIKYPKSEITICGDDDIANPENPGRKYATEAAEQLKCKVVFPKFPEDRKIDKNGESYKDFNDLMIICNKDEVNRQVKENAFIPELKKNIPSEEEIKKRKTIKSPSQNLNKSSESEDEEIEEHSYKGFVKVISNARRRALIYQSTHEEIVRDICKQHPTLCDQAEDIASKSLLWAEKYQIDCEVIVNGIPKKVTDMQSLDSRFAQLEAPGQPCVTIHRSDAQPISITDFNKRLSGEVVISGVGEKGQPKYLDASTFWTGNTRKYIYKSIVFTNKPVGNDTYNLFTGFGVKPKKGICDKILSHIKDVICADNEINYTALLKLLSWQIQNIGKPSRIITALKSKAQQAGKGCLLADIMAVIYGNSGFTTSDLGQIITRFNDTIRGKAFIFLDEALFAGDRKSADAIKSLATSTRMGVESKNIPTVQFPIAVNLFLSTNHDDAAHVEESDARYWILEVSPHRVGDTDYFQDLYAEIEGGGREAFMHYLLEINVKDFVPSRDVPTDNEYKEAMIRNSINPYDARKWLEECCRAEMILGLKPIDEDSNLPWEGWQKGMEYSNGIFHTAYTEWQKTIKSPIAPKPTPGNKFGELLNAAGLQLRIDGKRLRTLPEPSDCLKIVTEMI